MIYSPASACRVVVAPKKWHPKMSFFDRFWKRLFDIVLSFLGLVILWPVILVTNVIARSDTQATGFFYQQRVGRHGRLFNVVKLRTMRVEAGTNITTKDDVRITRSGAFFRRWKLDELPQLWNVLKGEMSFVGPRPDVPGYLDKLSGKNKLLLELRPGITGPASLKYRDEETILAQVDDPETYNDEVIWPDKVAINMEYYQNWSLKADLMYILKTLR